MTPPEFSVSLMCMDLMNAGAQLDVLDSHASGYHMDLMDGHFAPNVALSPDFIKATGRRSAVPMEVHLMTEDPTAWIDQLVANGSSTLSLHSETIIKNSFRLLTKIKESGCGAGVVLNPGTPLSQVQHYLSRIDLLTLMTVDVGYAGQPFIPEVLDKIREAVRLRETEGYQYKIQIDGSCNAKTFGVLREAGAEVFILGNSGLFDLDPDLETAWATMIGHFEAATGERVGG